MTSVFEPCLEVLPPAQLKLWSELRKVRDFGFVLYGGTAVALRLGHRRSVDFDFFTDRKLEKNKLSSQISIIKTATVLQDEQQSLTYLVQDESEEQFVKISFFGDIGFGRLEEPGITSDNVLSVASLNDLMATKLKVILQRIEAKDYIDIAAMIENGVELAKGLAGACLLYGRNFQPSESLKALTYFEGGDLDTLNARERKLLTDAASSVRKLPEVKLLSEHLN